MIFRKEQGDRLQPLLTDQTPVDTAESLKAQGHYWFVISTQILGLTGTAVSFISLASFISIMYYEVVV